MIMYVVDDVCYAGNPEILEKCVVGAKPLIGGILLVTFSSGERKLFDTTLLEGSAFEPLKEQEIFNDVRVEHGFVSWANGSIDLSPEYLYEHGIPYEEGEDCLKAS